MSSTDMFPSARLRKKPSPIILTPNAQPQGIVSSTHVVSLWKTQAIPKPSRQSIATQESKEKILFPEDTDDTVFWRTLVHSPSYKAPSIEQQLSTIKTLKKEYSEQFSSQTKPAGFFRNFKNWW